MKPIVLFSLQFTLSLAAYALIAAWYVIPRLSGKPREAALQPLVWVHAFRMIGGTVLAPGAVGVAVPILFQKMIGYGDLATSALALLALIALRARLTWAIPPGLGGPCRGSGGHHQRDHPVDAIRRVRPLAGRELGHRHDLRASAASEQRLDLVAASQVTGHGAASGGDDRQPMKAADQTGGSPAARTRAGEQHRTSTIPTQAKGKLDGPQAQRRQPSSASMTTS
jgi:hypothetical protein